MIIFISGRSYYEVLPFKYCIGKGQELSYWTIYTKHIREILLIIIIPKTIKIQRKEKILSFFRGNIPNFSYRSKDSRLLAIFFDDFIRL